MEKTYSQKVARVFEIFNYFLIIPATLGALLATLLLAGAAWFTLLIYTIYGIGLALFVGYFRHSRGKLDEQKIPLLWITTAIYNFVLLLPCLFYVAMWFQNETWVRPPAHGASKDSFMYFLISLSIVSGYLAAVIFSMRAYYFEKRKAFYQRNNVLKNFDKVEFS